MLDDLQTLLDHVVGIVIHDVTEDVLREDGQQLIMKIRVVVQRFQRFLNDLTYTLTRQP